MATTSYFPLFCCLLCMPDRSLFLVDETQTIATRSKTPINNKIVPCYEARFFTGQEQRRMGDVFHTPTPPAQQAPVLSHYLAHLLWRRFSEDLPVPTHQHLSGNPVRRNAVDADAVHSQLAGGASHEPYDGFFGQGVAMRGQASHDGRGAGGADDGSSSSRFDHGSCGVLDAVDVAIHVDGEKGFHPGHVGVGDAAGQPSDAGVVQHNI